MEYAIGIAVIVAFIGFVVWRSKKPSPGTGSPAKPSDGGSNDTAQN